MTLKTPHSGYQFFNLICLVLSLEGCNNCENCCILEQSSKTIFHVTFLHQF